MGIFDFLRPKKAEKRDGGDAGSYAATTAGSDSNDKDAATSDITNTSDSGSFWDSFSEGDGGSGDGGGGGGDGGGS